MAYYNYYSRDLITGEQKFVAWGGSTIPFTADDIKRKKMLHTKYHPGYELLIVEMPSLQDQIQNKELMKR